MLVSYFEDYLGSKFKIISSVKLLNSDNIYTVTFFKYVFGDCVNLAGSSGLVDTLC